MESSCAVRSRKQKAHSTLDTQRARTTRREVAATAHEKSRESSSKVCRRMRVINAAVGRQASGDSRRTLVMTADCRRAHSD